MSKRRCGREAHRIRGPAPAAAMKHGPLTRLCRCHRAPGVEPRERKKRCTLDPLACVLVRFAHIDQDRLTSLKPVVHLCRRGLRDRLAARGCGGPTCGLRFLMSFRTRLDLHRHVRPPARPDRAMHQRTENMPDSFIARGHSMFARRARRSWERVIASPLDQTNCKLPAPSPEPEKNHLAEGLNKSSLL